MKRVFQVSVACLPIVPIESLDLEDQQDQPWCVRIYKVDAHTEAQAEDFALDKFHQEIPISCVDHFAVYTAPVELNHNNERNI